MYEEGHGGIPSPSCLWLESQSHVAGLSVLSSIPALLPHGFSHFPNFSHKGGAITPRRQVVSRIRSVLVLHVSDYQQSGLVNQNRRICRSTRAGFGVRVLLI